MTCLIKYQNFISPNCSTGKFIWVKLTKCTQNWWRSLHWSIQKYTVLSVVSRKDLIILRTLQGQEVISDDIDVRMTGNLTRWHQRWWQDGDRPGGIQPHVKTCKYHNYEYNLYPSTQSRISTELIISQNISYLTIWHASSKINPHTEI